MADGTRKVYKPHDTVTLRLTADQVRFMLIGLRLCGSVSGEAARSAEPGRLRDTALSNEARFTAIYQEINRQFNEEGS